VWQEHACGTVGDERAVDVFVVGEPARADHDLQLHDGDVGRAGDARYERYLDVQGSFVCPWTWKQDTGEHDLGVDRCPGIDVEEQTQMAFLLRAADDRHFAGLFEDDRPNRDRCDCAALPHLGVDGAAFGALCFEALRGAAGDP